MHTFNFLVVKLIDLQFKGFMYSIVASLIITITRERALTTIWCSHWNLIFCQATYHASPSHQPFATSCLTDYPFHFGAYNVY